MGRIALFSSRKHEHSVQQEALSMLNTYKGIPHLIIDKATALGISFDSEGLLIRHPKGILAFDGAIFNLSQLRKLVDLPNGNEGEVLAELIGITGLPKALTQVNGDFALAWLETDSGKIWLARDPFGMRPLYYISNSSFIASSSQLRGLLAIKNISKAIDKSFLARFGAMHYRYIDNDPDKSPYADILQVPPATLISIDMRGQIQKFQYWSLEDKSNFNASANELAEEYKALLKESVNLRLFRFPKSTFTLSGGMDSSSVLALAATINGPQIAYSTLYEDRTYDERDDIKDMIQGNVSDWRHVQLSNNIDIISEIDQLIEIHDEPVATSTWLSHMHLCKQAATGEFNALFGGLGGDELNAGEYEYFPFHFADLIYENRHDEYMKEVALWAKYHDHSIFKKSPEIAKNLIGAFANLKNPGECIPDLSRLNKYYYVLSPEFLEHKGFSPKMDIIFDSYLKNRSWHDISRETLPCCIRAEDRHGATFGLTPILPFLDKRLVEFMYRVPGSMKIKNGITKHLLRLAMKDVLPGKTRQRIKKTGWNAPAHRWFTGKGAEAIQDLVNSNSFDDLKLFNRKEVMNIIKGHEMIVNSGAAKENHMMFLWQLTNLIRWQYSINCKK